MYKQIAALAVAGAFAHVAPYGQKDANGSGGEEGDLIKEIKSLGADLAKKHDSLKEDFGKLKTDAGDTSKQFDDFKSQVDEKFSGFNGNLEKIKSLVTDLEQKAARSGGKGEPAQSLGKQFVNSDGFKSKFANGVSQGMSYRHKFDAGAMASKSITDLDASGGPLLNPERLQGIVTPPQRRMTIRGLIAAGQTEASSIEFVREKLMTNNAGAQAAQGALKAESDITFELDDSKVRTIAHWTKVAKQMLADAPGLASFIDARMRYGYNFKEELAILKGDGENGTIEGLMETAAAFANPAAGKVTALSQIDVLRLAALQASINEYAADGIVLNSLDWALIELLKDDQGRYIIGQPNGQTGAMLWNLPVVSTNAMDADNFLVGAFGMAAQIFDREDVTVMVSTENQDDFVKNMATVLCEGRLALVKYFEDALVTGTFTAAIPA